MNRLILLLPTAFCSGCIIYDDNCKGRNAWECEVEAFDDGLSATQENEAQVPAAVFSLNPSEATAGETFIASLTAENFDLSTVGTVEIFGNAGVIATQNRGDELLLTVTVSADAQPGDVVDLLLNVGNDAVFVEAALSIVDPAETGQGEEGGGEDSEEDIDEGTEEEDCD